MSLSVCVFAWVFTEERVFCVYVAVFIFFRGELARNREYDGDDDYYYYYEMQLGW